MRRMDSQLGRREKGHLHIWPKELGLDDQVRQDVQREVTGKESCRDMTWGDYLKLKRHYEQIKAGQRAAGRPRGQKASASLKALYAAIQRRGDTPGQASVAQLEKITRMLDLPRGAEEQFLNRALTAYVGVRRWQWLTPGLAHRMIEALKARQQRRSA